MLSIGQRLEEARNRKGISLSEAAEATKIRSDFLNYFEQNNFDYDLPEIYRRGFLKNYAQYLKLDADKLLIDYDSQKLGKARSKQGAKELFGHDHSQDNAQKQLGRIGQPQAATQQSGQREPEAASGSERTFYLKISLLFVGTLAIIFIIFGLIKAILSPNIEAVTVTQTATSQSSESGPSPVAPLAIDIPQKTGTPLRLTASGTVTVMVKQKADNELIYRETLQAGDIVDLNKNGAVDIVFTAGELIQIEVDGTPIALNATGTAKVSLE
jgi:cytoskeletal protein RodZ